MRFPRFAVVSFTILVGCTTGAIRQAEMDTVFVGGTVAAGASQTPQGSYAIAVSSGRIRDVGPADEIRRRYRGARVVDTTGSTILPGLTDAHAHLYGLGFALETVNLVDTASLAEVVELVRARAAVASPGEWILGRGWDQNDWPVKEFPTAVTLSAAIPAHPVFLRRIDGHAALVNAAALRAAGISAATPDPPGGRIVRDERGEPTGVFVDSAMDLVERVIPAPSFEIVKRRIHTAAERIAARGLTEIHDAGADDETIRAVIQLIDENRFPIRVYTMLADDKALLARWFARGPLLDYGDRLTVRAVKLYADGALGSRGAALLEPYSDDPGNSGLAIATADHIEDVATRALRSGFQVGTHAIGDRGVRTVIDAYEKAGIGPAKRFRIEHLQVVAPSDFARLARSGIIASMQPTHATSDMYWAEARVGPERIRGAYAWRTVLNSGARLALGSDFPVEAVSPLFGLHAAVTRQDQKNWPEGGWYPSERLNLAEAIRGFTLDAAYAAFEESSRGTIEPGKLADFTIIEGDLYAMPPADLHKAAIRMTVVGGEIVYDSKSSK